MRNGLMSRVRSAGTKPERRVRAALRLLGLEFRVNAADLPGTPDVVLDESGTVVMVHGCFWHVHQECPRGMRLPNALWSRRGYWSEKLARNALRDRRVQAELEAKGWSVIVLWECEVSRRSARSLGALLRSRGVSFPRRGQEAIFDGRAPRRECQEPEEPPL